MTDQLPRLTVCLYTHMRHPDRLAYAKTTFESLYSNAMRNYPDTVRLHIADDNSRPEMLDELITLANSVVSAPDITVSHAMGRGYGASHNAATQVIHQRSDIILPLEDDWELVRPLPLERLVRYFENPEIRSVRLGYIGWTQRLRGHVIKAQDDTCLLLDPDSLEPHVNAGHPRLETVEYQRDVGPWAEGVDAGAVEFAWCSLQEARRGVVWPMDLGMSASQGHEGQYFAHIGSIQAREDQQP